MSAGRARRFLVPLLAAVVVLAVAAGVFGVGMVRRSFPQTGGELTVDGLSGPVEVFRDAQGTADIYADTPEDLFMAQGYVAAQDRFFQMDLRRHVTAGRLSELVGPSGLDVDKVIRTMGWRRVAEAELPTLSAETRRYLQSYAAGVNAYLADNPSPSQVALEYAVLGTQVPDYRIEPWTEVDSLAWLKAMAWDLKGDYEDELTRARLAGKLPLPQITTAYPPYPFETHQPILGADEWNTVVPADSDATDSRGGTAPSRPTPSRPTPGTTTPSTPTPDGPAAPEGPIQVGPRHQGPTQVQLAGAYEGTSEAMAAVPPLIGHGDGIGSNSWVVSGAHTATGKPLLANDPHLGVTQPGIWLQAGLHCRDVGPACPFDVSGFTFAGFPGVIIGHNGDIAWGFTNLDPDVTDFYLEEIEGTNYRRDNAWLPLETREEVIKVPGQDDVTITVRSTRHGPVMSDVLDPVRDVGIAAPVNGVETSTDYAVSMAWTGLQRTRTAEAVFALDRASGWEEFRSAAQLFAVPSQNLIYADTAGNIGYQAPGLVPIREASTNGAPPGYWPSLGSNSAYDWKGFVPFSQLPYAFNPPDGIIVTANQAVSAATQPFLTTEWDYGYRSQRINDRIAAQLAAGPLTVETMGAIQLDSRNDFADTLIPYLLDVDLNDDFYRAPQDLLRSWDRTAPVGDSSETEASSAGAMYFYAVWAQVLELTFDDELPPDLLADGGSRWMQVMTDLLERPDDKWWDDKRTVGITESRDEILRQAMIDARLELTRRIGKDPERWRWGALHQVAMSHEVFGGADIPGPIRAIFSEGPYPAPGGSSLVDAFAWDAGSGSFRVTAAPSMRMVVDLADLDASRWVNQTGNSGHPFDPNYSDQTQTWLEGGTYPWQFGRSAVEADQSDLLTLTPGP